MKIFLACLAIVTGSSLFYVYQEVEAVEIGYTIRKQEETKTLLIDRARALKYNIARLKSPNNMERRLSAQRIVLQSPKSWQTLVMAPVGSKAPAASGSLLNRPMMGKWFVGTAQAEAKE